MAISKKSLGKFIALSMASAMAMSSLSAALVSVSAVSPAAYTSNGSVELNDTFKDNMRATLGLDKDDHMDAIQGGELDVDDIVNAVKANLGNIEYTDGDGRTLPGIEVKDTDITVKAGGKLKLNDDGDAVVAHSTDTGKGTITVTVKGTFDLGAGKTKTFNNIKYVINVDVHKNGEYDLVAYKGTHKEENRLTKTDLNELAAYDAKNIEFVFSKYTKNGTELKAVVEDVNRGTPAPVAATVKAADVKTTMLELLKDQIDDEDPDAMHTADYNAIKAKVDAWFTANTTDLDASDKIGTVASDPQFGLEDVVTSPAGDGWKITVKTSATGIKAQMTDALLQTEGADAATQLQTTDTGALGTGVYKCDGKFYTAAGTVGTTEQLYFKAKASTPEMIYVRKASGSTNTSDVGKVVTSANKAGTADDDYVIVKEVERITALTQAQKDAGLKSTTTAWTATATDTLEGNIEAAIAKLAATSTNKAGNNSTALTWGKYDDGQGTITYYFKNQPTDSDATGIGHEFLEQFITTVTTGSTKDVDSTTNPAVTAPNPYIQDVNEAFNDAIDAELAKLTGASTVTTTGARIYATSGDDLFTEVNNAGVEVPNSQWGKGRASTTDLDKFNKAGGVIIDNNAPITVRLATNGKTGSATVEAAIIDKDDNLNPIVTTKSLSVKIVKAVDFGGSTVSIDRKGGKTSTGNEHDCTKDRNINGFEIRNKNSSVTVKGGTLGAIKDASTVSVDEGTVGTIDAADDATVTIGKNGTAGDIVNAASVRVEEGGRAGKITSGSVSLEEGTIDSIDTNDSVELKGGTVNGDVITSGKITIDCGNEDTNEDAMDTIIHGDVRSIGNVIEINNTSDNGEAAVQIDGDVAARFANTSNANTDTVKIGATDTEGAIRVKGAVEGEKISLGGNGLVSIAGVRAADEVEYTAKEVEKIESSLKFEGFNSVIDAISGFENITVEAGTLTVKGTLSTTNLSISSDSQVVADAITVDGDIDDSGSIVVPAGKLIVNGDVNDDPSLAFLGDYKAGDLGFAGNHGLLNKFQSGGITFKADRQSNGDYNYLIDGMTLDSLTAVGKDVALGVGQTKTVSVALDGTLPEGASIKWEIDDEEVATITGDGLNAEITGKDIDTTTVTATIVDADGKDLRYGEANFEVNVLGVDTVDSIGGNVGPSDNENPVNLDTTRKNMEVGQTYTFMVRGNNDVDNISITSDESVATVALANGADSRGALYTITAVGNGKTDVAVTYQGKTSKIAVKVGGFALDTTSKKLAPEQTYSFLAKNVPADQAGNVTLAFDANIVNVVKTQDDYNGRGVLYTITGKALGTTDVKATYNGETESMSVAVVENTGKLTLDTASYTMPAGGTYTIGVKVEKNGKALTNDEVRAMINSGELRVTDSRSGSIVNIAVQDNGNVRVTGRSNPGTAYINFDVMQNGQVVAHASVGVTVQPGATAGGSAKRSISQW